MLTIDIGLKHFVACHSIDKIHFEIYMFEILQTKFDNILKEINEHLGKI